MGLFGPPNVEKLKARGDVAGLIKALDYQKDELVRDQAAVALGDLGDPGAVAALIAALKDSQSKVRIAAAGALGQIGTPSAVEPLIAALKDKENNLHAAAAQALVKIGPPAFKALIAALTDDRDHIRLAAVQALGQIGERMEDGALKAEGMIALGAALKDGREKEAAAAAMEKIGWIPDKGELGAAYWIIKHRWDKCVEIGAPALEPLIEALKENDYAVCKGAAGALGQIGDLRAVEPLTAALFDNNLEMCKSAAAALVQIGSPKATKALIARLLRGGGEIRRIAADALGQTGDPLAVAPLLTAIKDGDGGLRTEAVTALVKIGLPAIKPLIETLRDKRGDVRAAAAEALGQIGPRLNDDALRAEALAALGAALKDIDVYKPAAVALLQFGGPEATYQLIAGLQESNPYQAKAAAAEALEKTGWRPSQDADGAAYWVIKQNWEKCVEMGVLAVKPLVAALQDRNLRESASNALASIGIPAVDALVTALRDRNNDVRHAAAGTLDRIGWRADQNETGANYWISKRDWDKCIETGATAIEPLIATLKDELVDVRKGVADALGQIGAGLKDSVLQSNVTDGLIVALQDEESVVRQAAALGLGRMASKLEAVGLLERVLSALIPALRRTPQAATTLVEIGPPAVRQLIIVLEESDDIIREAAARLLGQIGDGRAVDALVSTLQVESRTTTVSSVAVRQASAVALGQIEDARAIKPLITALNDKSSSVRHAAAAALGQAGVRLENAELLTRTVGELAAALNDSEQTVSKAAAGALVKIGSAAAGPLVSRLKDEKTATREQAADILEKIGWQPGKDELGIAYWVIKRNWARCYELGRPAFGQLIPALLDYGVTKPLVAEDWLVKIGKPAVEPLIAALHDSRSEVRMVAGSALVQIGDARAVSPLVSMLGHNDWLTRKRAAEALVRMYKSGSLDEASRQVILAHRARISASHDDRNQHGDVDRTNSDCHGDTIHHADNNGIGVSFPA